MVLPLGVRMRVGLRWKKSIVPTVLNGVLNGVLNWDVCDFLGSISFFSAFSDRFNQASIYHQNHSHDSLRLFREIK